MSISNLKKSMSTNLQKLKSIAEAESKKGGRATDETLWSPTFDKEKGTGSATIRFMPAPNGEDVPYVKVFSHNFQGPTGKYYIENSLSTIGARDALSSLNYRLWNSGVESDKKLSQKRKVTYTANVYVVDDPAHPESNGTVKKYKFGPKIYEMLQSRMFPEFDDVKALDPFDPWSGADFVIRMKGQEMVDSRGKKITVPNYDKSSFREPSAIAENDEEIERIWKQCHSLQAIIAPDQFKTPEALAKRLFEVLGPYVGSGVETVEGWGKKPAEQEPTKQPSKAKEEFDDVPWDDDANAAHTPPVKSPAKSASTKKPAKPEEDSDDDLEFLKSLVE